MSRHFFKYSAATLALVAGIGTGAMAQDAAPAAPTANLPEALSVLNLQNVETEEGRRGGRKIEGDLPGGGEIEAFVSAENALMMVEVDDALMPQSLIDTLLPQTVRDNDILSQFALIDQIGGREDRFMVGGEDADGEDLRAGFDQDGRLLRFGRDDDDDRGMRGHEDGERGGKKHGDKKRGDKKHGGKGDRDRGDQARGERGNGEGRMPQVDAEAMNQRLDGAGYSDVSEPRPAGPRMLVDATNAAGEPVTLEVDPAGEVIRETAR